MQEICFIEAKQKISYDEIEGIVNNKDTASNKAKILGSFLLAVLVSLPSTNYYGIFSVCSILLLGIIFFKYVTSNSLFKKLSYNTVMYALWQTGTIFFLTVFLYVKTDKYHVFPILYVFVSYMIAYYVIRNKTTNLLKVEYGIPLKNNYAGPLTNKISRLLQVFLAIVIAGSILYRTNKWWLMNLEVSSADASILEYIIWGVGLIVY
ncbi:hypothetical protein [Enterococcus rivorum]|uniref:hypothetical protein n=1 Tax=Enterococcus rivorum TaxID=762845 RepID=UPI003638F906